MTLLFYELIDLKLNKQKPKGKQNNEKKNTYEKITNTEISIATFWKISSDIYDSDKGSGTDIKKKHY